MSKKTKAELMEENAKLKEQIEALGDAGASDAAPRTPGVYVQNDEELSRLPTGSYDVVQEEGVAKISEASALETLEGWCREEVGNERYDAAVAAAYEQFEDKDDWKALGVRGRDLAVLEQLVKLPEPVKDKDSVRAVEIMQGDIQALTVQRDEAREEVLKFKTRMGTLHGSVDDLPSVV